MTAIAWLLFTQLQAQPPGLADFLSMPFPTNLVAAPQGKAIAWVFNKEGERNIYYAAAPQFEVIRLTSFEGDEGVEISQLQFSPDGQQLYFVYGNGNNSDGEPANPAQLQATTGKRIFVADIAKRIHRMLAAGSSPTPSPDGRLLAYLYRGQVWRLYPGDTTRPAPLFSSRGGVNQLQWRPNGEELAFVSLRGDHSFIGLYNVLDRQLRFIETSVDHDAYPSWSPDGNQLAYLRIPDVLHQLPFTPMRTGQPWSIRVWDARTKIAREVFKADTGRGSVFVDDVPAIDQRLWWTRQQQLIFPWEKNGWMQLYRLDLSTKAVEHLTPGEGEVEMLSAGASQEGLLITSNIGNINKRHIQFIDYATGAVKTLTPAEQICFAAVPVLDGFACLQASATQPAWPAISRYGAPLQPLAASLKSSRFLQRDLQAPKTVAIKAADGIESYAQLLLPANYQSAKKYPAVIFLHGGSRRQMLEGFHYGLYYSNAYALQQYFASQGFVALTLNYRSGIGYGLQFREADNYGAAGASEVQDVMAAAAWLAARSDVDARRIVPWGGSYGGYLTAHALSQAPGRFLCGVDIHGVHNWNNDIPVFAPWYQPEKFPDMAKLAFQSSPMNYVQQWREPVLLIHGDDDRNVLFSESVELANALRKQGVAVEQLVLPDEVHSFLLHRSWLQVYGATFQYIQKQVKNAQ